jgi:hypothetical protein
MLEPIELTPGEIEEFKGFTQQEIWAEMADGPSVNPAVNRCMRACNRAAKKTRAELGTSEEAEFIVAKEARFRYLRAMPPLDSYENVRDFIACVSFAEVLNLILHHQAEDLLSSAKFALAALRLEKKPSRGPGRPPKSAAKRK